MSSTFISLTNQLLRQLNEVEIAQPDFGNTRGVQSLAKDAVRNAVAKINQTEFEWPFNAAEHSVTLVEGQEEYSWPALFKTADWNSFQIQKNEEFGVGYKTLKFIERDVWYKNYRDEDYDAGSAGIECPDYVFPSHGNGFGVSPSPDHPYELRFRYYMTDSTLLNADDAVRIPSIFDHVIISGALYYMYMFRDNAESSNIAATVFEQGVKEMRTLLINKYERIADTRVRY